MPVFRYRAIDASGRLARGSLAAANETELARFLGLSRLELIAARPQRRLKPVAPEWKRRVPPRMLAQFCAQMADMLSAGIPLLDALQDLALTMPQGALRHAIQDVARDLTHGAGLAASLRKRAALFPPVMMAIVASGEASGDMAQAFTHAARYLESRARIQEKLRRALRYPLFLVVVAAAVVTFMMVMVVPQIVAFLNSLDGKLPLLTRALIAVSRFFSVVWIWGVLAAGVLSVAVTAARHLFPAFAVWVDGVLLRLPLIGHVMERLMVARFAQSLSILVQSGLTLPDALRGAHDTLGNRALERRLDDMGRRLQHGTPLSKAAEVLFPVYAARVLAVGEQGGHVPKALMDIAAHYDREASDDAERMIGVFEPALTLVVGAILAWVVLAVLGPIYGSLALLNSQGG